MWYIQGDRMSCGQEMKGLFPCSCGEGVHDGDFCLDVGRRTGKREREGCVCGKHCEGFWRWRTAQASMEFARWV